MGEARRRRLARESATSELEPAVKQVTDALRKLCMASSQHFGRDCHLHTWLAQGLFRDLGFETQIQAGYAAWRVGEGNQDVLAHAPEADEVVPDDPQKSLMYHAWLGYGDLIVDVTLYQIGRKVRELDAMFGGHTHIRWAPDYVIVRPDEIRTIEELAQSYRPGDLYYSRRPRVEQVLNDARNVFDPQDLEMARLVMRNPKMYVAGLFSERNG